MSQAGVMCVDASCVCYVVLCVLCCYECELDMSRCLGEEEIIFGCLLCLASYLWYLGSVVDLWCVFGGLGFSIEVVCCGVV